MVEPDRSVESLGRRVAVGAAWMVSLRMSLRLMGFGSTLVLVRLLAPQDFGIIAMASAAYGTLDMLSEFSFNLALIQMKAPKGRHYDTAWTFLVLRGAVIASLMAVSAPYLAGFMNEPRVEPVIFVLSFSPLLQGFENIRLVDWRRTLRFDRIFTYQLAGKLIGMCIAVPAAFIFRNYWALILGPLGARVILIPLSYRLEPYRPRFSITARHELFHFSKWLIVSNLVSVLDVYIMTFIVGRISGPGALGQYQIAKEIGELPGSEIAAPIRQPMYTGFVNVAHDTEKLREQALDGLGIVLLLVVPLSVGLAVTSKLATTLFLGAKWLDAAPLVGICALTGLFESIGYFTYHLYLVKNAQARFTSILIATVALRIALIIPFAIWYGVIGAALVILATSILNCVARLGGLLRLLGIRWRDILEVVWRTAFSAGAMATVVLVTDQHWQTSINSLSTAFKLVVVCTLGAAVFSIFQILLWLVCGRVGPERHVADLIRRAIARCRLRTVG